MSKFGVILMKLMLKYMIIKLFFGCFFLDFSGCLDIIINNILVEVFIVFVEYDMIYVVLFKYLDRIYIFWLWNIFECDVLI